MKSDIRPASQRAGARSAVSTRGVTLLLLGSCVLSGGFLHAGDWLRFRGPNGAGVTAGKLPAEFGHDRNLLWRTPLPPGHSSPVLSDRHVFVTAHRGETLLTIALDRRSGRQVWEAEAPRSRSQRVDSRNNPASPSPVTDGTNVYVFFQDFGLLSYDAAGRERWRLPLGPFNNAYGMGASPILAGDIVVLVCDQSQGSFMVGVDTHDGRVRWRTERPDATSGHSTPVLFEPSRGTRQLLVPGSFFLTAYNADSGEALWWAGGLAFEMKATPVHDGRTVYISGTSTSSFQDSYGGDVPSFSDLAAADVDRDRRFSPEEVPDELARKWVRLLDLDGDGYLDEEEWERFRKARRNAGGLWAYRMGGSGNVSDTNVVWHHERAIPQLPSPLLYEGLLVLVNDGGIVRAFDPRTGSILGQRRLEGAVDSYYASPVAADRKIILASLSGRISVLGADADLPVLAVNDIDEPVYATPAIADDRLFVRTGSALYCFGLP